MASTPDCLTLRQPSTTACAGVHPSHAIVSQVMGLLSAKAAGKRRASSSTREDDTPYTAVLKQHSGLTAAGGRITRATRSSLGPSGSEAGTSGSGDCRSLESASHTLKSDQHAHSLYTADIQPQAFLPKHTAIIFSSSLPQGLTHHPPGANDPAALPKPAPPAPTTASPQPEAVTATAQVNELTPIFHLLGPGDSFSRSRHAGASEVSPIFRNAPSSQSCTRCP